VWRITPEAAAGKALSIASGATGGGEPTEDGHLYGGAPLAFVHYRFLEDDAKPVRTSPFAIAQHDRALSKHLLPSAPVMPPFPGQVLYIYEIQVGEGARGMGVGQRLMKEVEAEARHKNMAKVLLTVFKRNHAAIHFYKKGDFELVSGWCCGVRWSLRTEVQHVGRLKSVEYVPDSWAALRCDH